jgi:PAS domain S-box-containing protein
MKKYSRSSWLFPCCLFIFFSIYLLVKFIFIFFFRASFEPRFIFELTPFYLLSGLSSLQLGLLSLLIIFTDMYLHLRSGKRNLLLSFLPTSVMLSSLGFTIMFSPMGITYIYHYGMFGCLLLVVLIDYQYVLKGVETQVRFRREEPVRIKVKENKHAPVRVKSLFAKKAQANQQPPVPLVTANSAELKGLSNNILQKMQTMLEDLERKTVRIEKLENDIEEQRRNLIRREKMVTDRAIPYFDPKEKIQIDEKNLSRNIPSDDKIFMKEKIEDRLIIDDTNEFVAVVQRGIFKQISNSFAGFLGYESTDLLQKSFFVFIAPHGFENARKYYLNRLKGVTSNSFRTVLLTKEHTELLVEITVTPTIYMGDAAEFLSLKEVKDMSQNT